jgi:hypothetical protein
MRAFTGFDCLGLKPTLTPAADRYALQLFRVGVQKNVADTLRNYLPRNISAQLALVRF